MLLGFAKITRDITERQQAHEEILQSERRYGRGSNPVDAGANIAAGAVNTAGASAFGALNTAGAIATAPFAGPGWNDGYYGSSTWGDYECRYGAPWIPPLRREMGSIGSLLSRRRQRHLST